MSEFAARTLEKRKVISIAKNPISKNVDVPLELCKFPAIAVVLHKGKDTIIVVAPGQTEDMWRVRIQYGMSGHWEHHTTRFSNKHSLLSFELSSGTFLEYVDPRRFGRWVFGKNDLSWSVDCPDLFDDKFESHVWECSTIPKYGKKYLCEILLDQHVWWGIGNYLRAEIIFRAWQNPFAKFGDLTKEQVGILVDIARQVVEEAYAIGGGKLFTWKNPLKDTVPNASAWLECYQKLEWCIDGTGRRFWYDPQWKGPFGKEAPKKTKKAPSETLIED